MMSTIFSMAEHYDNTKEWESKRKINQILWQREKQHRIRLAGNQIFWLASNLGENLENKNPFTQFCRKGVSNKVVLIGLLRDELLNILQSILWEKSTQPISIECQVVLTFFIIIIIMHIMYCKNEFYWWLYKNKK